MAKKNTTPAVVDNTNGSLAVISEYMTLKVSIRDARKHLKDMVAKRQVLEGKVEAAMNLPGGYPIRILNPKKEK